MRKFTEKMVVTSFELQQLAIDFCRDADFNDARNITDYYAEDGVLMAGETVVEGRDAIRRFYEDRNRRVLSEQRGGVRTLRHTFTNTQVIIHDDENATLNFGNMNYTGEGAAPVPGFVGPSLFSDCEMRLRKVGDEWFVALFRGSAVFYGDDAFINKTLKLDQGN